MESRTKLLKRLERLRGQRVTNPVLQRVLRADVLQLERQLGISRRAKPKAKKPGKPKILRMKEKINWLLEHLSNEELCELLGEGVCRVIVEKLEGFTVPEEKPVGPFVPPARVEEPYRFYVPAEMR